LLLGETREELSGSEWAHVVHGHLGGLPPRLDLGAERALAALLHDAARDGVVTSAHDLSDGGLAQALAESTFARDIGVTVSLASVAGDAFVALFSESTARALVTVTDEQADALVALAQRHGVPLTPLGRTGGDTISVEGSFDLPVAEAKAAWRATLPAVLGA
jgi:phosphoribosylformylglycinamidine synthase